MSMLPDSVQHFRDNLPEQHGHSAFGAECSVESGSRVLIPASDASSDVTGLVRLLVGWLEKLQKSQPVRSFDWLPAGWF